MNISLYVGYISWLFGVPSNKSTVGLQKSGASQKPRETPTVIQWGCSGILQTWPWEKSASLQSSQCLWKDEPSKRSWPSLQHLAQGSESARLKWRFEVVAQQIFDAPQPISAPWRPMASHSPPGCWATPCQRHSISSTYQHHQQPATTAQGAKHPIGLQITGFPSKIIEISVWRHESSKSP